MSLPSNYLPSLHPPPLPTELLSLLANLAAELLPNHQTVDLRSWAPPPTARGLDPSVGNKRDGHEDDGADDSVETDEGVDSFEREFARGWLNRVVMAGTRRVGMGEEEWEEVVERAAGLISGMAGDCSSAGSTTTYLLPAPPSYTHAIPHTASPAYPSPPPTRIASPLPPDPLSITIRSTTLLASSTGFRTWSSASIFAAAIAASPVRFFPWLGESVAAGMAAPSRVLPVRRRVLELGAGTGLVGLTAAAALAAAGGGAVDVDLTDFETLVLENLRYNVEGNPVGQSRPDEPAIERYVRRLDWSEVAADWAPIAGRPQAERYDALLAADVVYEPQHLLWLHPTISSLLRVPSAASPSPRLWLLLPLRPTHAAETRAVDRAFARAPRAAEGEESEVGEELRGRYSVDGEGRRWVLRAAERGEVRAKDGFSAKSNAGGVRLHWMYRIQWELLEEL